MIVLHLIQIMAPVARGVLGGNFLQNFLNVVYTDSNATGTYKLGLVINSLPPFSLQERNLRIITL